MHRELPGKEKDKRLLVLFAFGLLILLGDVEFSEQLDKSIPNNHAWITIQDQDKKVYRVDSNKDFTFSSLENFATDRINTNKFSRKLEHGRVYTFQNSSEAELSIGAGTPRLAFFLGQQLDINASDAEDLTLIHGVGPSLASRIVTYREAYGPITNADLLEKIPGIGLKTRQKLEHYFSFTVASEQN